MKTKMKLAWINARHWAAAVATVGLYPVLLAALPAYITLASLLVLRQALRGDLSEGLVHFKKVAETYIDAWKGVTELVKECLQ